MTGSAVYNDSDETTYILAVNILAVNILVPFSLLIYNGLNRSSLRNDPYTKTCATYIFKPYTSVY